MAPSASPAPLRPPPPQCCTAHQILLRHLLLAQSVLRLQFLPSVHLGQVPPPQSTSVSGGSTAPFEHRLATHTPLTEQNGVVVGQMQFVLEASHGPMVLVQMGLQTGLVGSVTVSQRWPLVQPVPLARHACGAQCKHKGSSLRACWQTICSCGGRCVGCSVQCASSRAPPTHTFLNGAQDVVGHFEHMHNLRQAPPPPPAPAQLTTHLFSVPTVVQMLLRQSVLTLQRWPRAHLGQVPPPQSTSVSNPFLVPSEHCPTHVLETQLVLVGQRQTEFWGSHVKLEPLQVGLQVGLAGSVVTSQRWPEGQPLLPAARHTCGWGCQWINWVGGCANLGGAGWVHESQYRKHRALDGGALAAKGLPRSGEQRHSLFACLPTQTPLPYHASVVESIAGRLAPGGAGRRAAGVGGPRDERAGNAGLQKRT